MQQKEAAVILELGQDYDFEEIRRNYISLFIETFREKAAAVTILESEQLEDVLRRINMAFCSLTGISYGGETSFQVVFEPDNLTIRPPGKPGPFEMAAEKLMNDGETGLALRFLEICLAHSGRKDLSHERIDEVLALRLFGHALIQCGLVDQGIEFSTKGMNHYEKGRAYSSIGDHKSAVHHLAYELSLRESAVPIDEVCRQIAVHYFLLNDYANAVNMIEEVMPKLMLKKEIFQEPYRSKKFAMVMLICIERLTGLKYNKIESLKLRIRFPLSFKYFQNCFGSVHQAFNLLDDLNSNPEKYGAFLASLQSESMVREGVNLHYDVEDLQAIYYQVFREPMQKSLIYHPK